MNKTTTLLLGLAATLALTVAVPVAAGQLAQLEDAQMDVIDSGRKHHGGKKHKGRKEAHRLISEYMLKNGDISQAELDARKAERKVVRVELRALRDSGNEEALHQRLDELREERHARHEQMRDYIDDHQALADLLKERRKAFREKRKAKQLLSKETKG